MAAMNVVEGDAFHNENNANCFSSMGGMSRDEIECEEQRRKKVWLEVPEGILNKASHGKK